MKRTYDVVIVGGGAVGLSIALRLARAKLDVVVLEKGPVGREASWAGAGLLSPLDAVASSPAGLFHDHSLIMFEEFCARLQEDSGIDPEFNRCGEIHLLSDEEELEQARQLIRDRDHWFPGSSDPAFEWVESSQIHRLDPRIEWGGIGAFFSRFSAQCRTTRFMAALAASCRRAGATLIEGCMVESLIGDEPGLIDNHVIQGVRTPIGEFSAEHVIVAAGAWSSEFSPRLASVTPVRPVRGQMILLQSQPGWLQVAVSHRHKYLVPRRDGRILLGATLEAQAGFTKRVTPRGMAELIDAASAMCPTINGLAVESNWSGLRPGTPDGLPHIGRLGTGLIVATGHYRTGLTLAPATAEAVEALLESRTLPVPLDFCRPGRGPQLVSPSAG
ncbi:MAG: glycine oxidase ThiO [Phycisphaerae bacterium]